MCLGHDSGLTMTPGSSPTLFSDLKVPFPCLNSIFLSRIDLKLDRRFAWSFVGIYFCLMRKMIDMPALPCVKIIENKERVLTTHRKIIISLENTIIWGKNIWGKPIKYAYDTLRKYQLKRAIVFWWTISATCNQGTKNRMRKAPVHELWATIIPKHPLLVSPILDIGSISSVSQPP